MNFNGSSITLELFTIVMITIIFPSQPPRYLPQQLFFCLPCIIDPKLPLHPQTTDRPSVLPKRSIVESFLSKHFLVPCRSVVLTWSILDDFIRVVLCPRMGTPFY